MSPVLLGAVVAVAMLWTLWALHQLLDDEERHLPAAYLAMAVTSVLWGYIVALLLSRG